jgi:hypothetical protein
MIVPGREPLALVICRENADCDEDDRGEAGEYRAMKAKVHCLHNKECLDEMSIDAVFPPRNGDL